MKQYYFNNMIVGIQLYYQEKSDRFLYTDNFVYDGFFRKNKVLKFDNPVWIDKCYFYYDKRVYKTVDELIKGIKREYPNRTVSIINHEVYFDSMIKLIYANGDKIYKCFKSDKEAEEYYNFIIKDNPGIECVQND